MCVRERVCLRARVCGEREGFQIFAAEREDSFKEVTDEARGTGQRKFARCWSRSAGTKFSPL